MSGSPASSDKCRDGSFSQLQSSPSNEYNDVKKKVSFSPQTEVFIFRKEHLKPVRIENAPLRAGHRMSKEPYEQINSLESEENLEDLSTPANVACDPAQSESTLGPESVTLLACELKKMTLNSENHTYVDGNRDQASYLESNQENNLIGLDRVSKIVYEGDKATIDSVSKNLFDPEEPNSILFRKKTESELDTFFCKPLSETCIPRGRSVLGKRKAPAIRIEHLHSKKICTRSEPRLFKLTTPQEEFSTWPNIFKKSRRKENNEAFGTVEQDGNAVEVVPNGFGENRHRYSNPFPVIGFASLGKKLSEHSWL